jgi:glucose/arabinose dehydrogenase
LHHLKRLTTAVVIASWGFTGLAQGPLEVVQHSTGYNQVLAYIQDPLDPNTKFAVQKNGVIHKVTGGVITNTLIDMSGSITFNPGDEQGMLGLAFAPDHASSGHLYLYFNNTAGDIQVARFTRSGDTAALGTRLDIIGIPHPGVANHNGATPVFGPDGFLYLGIGDGSPFDDINLNAQNPNVLL